MSTALNPKEELSEGFLRVLREEVGHAVSSLGDLKVNQAEAVHEARRHTKRVRALLRLLRQELGKGRYAIENNWFREIARELSPARDRQVVADRARELLAGSENVPSSEISAELEAALEKWSSRDVREILSGTKIASLVKRLQLGERRLSKWSPLSNKLSPYIGSMEHAYRQGRKMLRTSVASPSTENLHEWRKRVKYLFYQLEVFTKEMPKVVRNDLRLAEDLGDVLGIYHDSVLLEQALEGELKQVIPELLRSALQKRLVVEKEELREHAFYLGRCLFAESPRSFGKRQRAYWKAQAERAIKSPRELPSHAPAIATSEAIASGSV